MRQRRIALPPQAAVSLLAGITLVVTFLTQALAAAVVGVETSLDAYFAASTVPVLFTGLFSSVLVSSLLPEIARHEAAGDDEGSWRVANGTLNALIGILMLATAGGVVVGRPILSVIAGGLPEASLNLAASLLWLLWPASSLTAIALFFSGLHQSRRRFERAVGATTAGSIVTFLAAFFLLRMFGVTGLAAASILGSLVQLLLVLPDGLGRRGPRLHPLYVRAAGGVLLLALPLLGGGLIYQSVLILDRAVASTLPAGSITYISFSQKLTGAVATLVGTGVVAVGFVTMSALAARRDVDSLRRVVALNVRVLWAFALPIAGVLAATRVPLVALLFERGRFGPVDSAAVASILPFYLLAMVGMTIGSLVGGALYALQRNLLAAVIGVAWVGGYALYMPLLAQRYGLAGLTAAGAFYYLIGVLPPAAALWWIVGRPNFLWFAVALLRVALASAVAAAVAGLADRWLPASPLLRFSVALGLGSIAYLSALWLLRSEELWLGIRRIRLALARETATEPRLFPAETP